MHELDMYMLTLD